MALRNALASSGVNGRSSRKEIRGGSMSVATFRATRRHRIAVFNDIRRTTRALSYPAPTGPKYYLLTQATSIKPKTKDSYDVVPHGLSSLHDYIFAESNRPQDAQSTPEN